MNPLQTYIICVMSYEIDRYYYILDFFSPVYGKRQILNTVQGHFPSQLNLECKTEWESMQSHLQHSSVSFFWLLLLCLLWVWVCIFVIVFSIFLSFSNIILSSTNKEKSMYIQCKYISFCTTPPPPWNEMLRDWIAAIESTSTAWKRKIDLSRQHTKRTCIHTCAYTSYGVIHVHVRLCMHRANYDGQYFR